MRIAKVFVLFCMLIIFAEMAYSTGISGGNLAAKVRFTPNMQYGFQYSLVGGMYNNSYTCSAMGDLAQYVKFESTRLENIPAYSSAPITGVIQFPESLDPGWHRLNICVLEDCAGGGMVCGRAGACAIIDFEVLHPGIKPVLNSFTAQNVNENDPVTFTASVTNLGLENISIVTGDVDVLNKKGAVVGTARFDTISIADGATGTINAVFDSLGLQPADYDARANIMADDVPLTGNASFKIGSLDVKLNDYTKELEVGGIKRFILTVESGWNDPIPIFADVTIYDKNTSSTTRTATNTLEPWSMADLEAYIDTTSLQAKEYDLRMDIQFAGESRSFNKKLLLVAPPGAEQESEKEAPGDSTLIVLTVSLIIIVILLTLLNLFLLMKRKKKKEE